MGSEEDRKLMLKIIKLITEHPGTGGKKLKSVKFKWHRETTGGYTLEGYMAQWEYPK